MSANVASPSKNRHHQNLRHQTIHSHQSSGPQKTRRKLKILYWNCRSFDHRQVELQTLINDVDILVCAESRLKPKDNRPRTFPGFYTIRKDREYSTGGGLLVAIRKNIAYKQIETPDISDRLIESIGFQITNSIPAFNLYAFYKPPRTTLNSSDWDEICALSSPPHQSIIIGDFNAHHQAWNCKENDRHGDKLFDSVVTYDLIVHNTDTITRYDEHSESNIDLVLSSTSLSDNIKVSVMDETYGSDHFPVLTQVAIEKHIYNKRSFKLNSVRTEWENVSKSLENSFQQTFCDAEYDGLAPRDKYQRFINHVSETLRDNTPRKKQVPPSRHRNPVHWWDMECHNARAHRVATYAQWKITKSPTDWTEHKNAISNANKLFKMKKKTSFKSFAESINIRLNPAYVWNSCKIFKNRWVNNSPMNKTENVRIDEHVENALNSISPAWCPTDPSYLPPCKRNPELHAPFTYLEFNLALETRKNKSAPGMDGIDYTALKKLPQ